jgi:8-oxo-dGTP pyrophosphatase MutT (NUDIX family)
MEPVITSACSLIINPQGLVLGVSRRTDPNDFGLPGGRREPIDKDGFDIAIRETWEETRVVLYRDHMIPIFAEQGRKFFCATYLATKYDDTEMCSSEEGVVKWLDYADVVPGTFKEYNTLLLREILKAFTSIQLVRSMPEGLTLRT